MGCLTMFLEHGKICKSICFLLAGIQSMYVYSIHNAIGHMFILRIIVINCNSFDLLQQVFL